MPARDSGLTPTVFLSLILILIHATFRVESGIMGADTPQVSRVQDVVTTFRPSRLFPGSAKAIYTSIDFDDSGEFLLLARTDDTIQLYNTKAGAYAKDLKSQKYGCALARFTHHSTSIIYASTKVDNGIRYLSMHDNSFIRYFKGHEDRVTGLCVSPSSDHFLSASLDNTVRLWDCRSPNAQGQLEFECPYLVAYDASASVIAIASPPAQSVLMYDLRNYDKPPFVAFDLEPIEQKYARYGQKTGQGWSGLELSNNGKFLLITTSGAGHYLLDAFDGRLVHYLHRPSSSSTRLAPGDPISESTPAYTQGDASFAPDGRYVIGGNGSKTGLLVWDSQREPSPDGVLEPICDLPSSRTAAVVAYNPRHNFIASADKDVTMWVPDAELV